MAALLLMSLVLSFLAYGRALHGFFVGDDLEVIWRSTAFDPAMPSLGYASNYWRPVTELTIRLNHAVGGLDPFGYHLVNVLGHAAAATLVGVCAVVLTCWMERRRSTPGDRAGAVVASCGFAVLPSHSEAVAWIAGRGDVLMTLFGLAALLTFVVSRRIRDGGGSRPAASLTVVASMVLLTVALLAKESAVAIPAAAVVLEFARERNATVPARVAPAARRSLAATSPLLAVTGVWFVARYRTMGSFVGGFSDAASQLSPLRLVRNGGAVIVRSVLPSMAPASWLLAGSIASLTLVVVALVVIRGRHRESIGQPRVHDWLVGRTVAAYVVCVVLSALPVSALGVDATSVAGERLTYLPSAFAVLAVIRAWSLLWPRQRAIAMASAAAVLAVATLVLWAECGEWVDASNESEHLVSALGVLLTDQPAVVVDSHERSADRVPVALNALGPAVVLFHGWSDPSVISDAPSASENLLPPAVWTFDGVDLRRSD